MAKLKEIEGHMPEFNDEKIGISYVSVQSDNQTYNESKIDMNSNFQPTTKSMHVSKLFRDPGEKSSSAKYLQGNLQKLPRPSPTNASLEFNYGLIQFQMGQIQI